VRLFVGLPVPPTVSEALGELQRAVADQLPDLDIRWQAIDGAHLTLLFLGEVDDSALAACHRSLEAAAGRHAAPTLTTTPPGAFPGPARPSVLWLGVEESVDLTDLHRDLARQFAALRLIGHAVRFRPHLTLGRLRRPPADPTELLQVLAERAPEAMRWRATEAILYRSRTTRAGAHYTPLARIPFADDKGA
jgi:2'-5' RNA ligase